MHIQWPRSRVVRSWRRWLLALILTLAGLGDQLARARTSTAIVTIRVSTWPTLLAIDPGTHQVYVRTLGITDHYGNPGIGAGYTLLDGTTGKVLHVWPDTGGYPPVSFVPTDNGLWAVVPPYPAAVYNPIPMVTAMIARMGPGVTIQGNVVADQQRKLVALITIPSGQFQSLTETLWIFDAKTAHLLGRTTLPHTAQALTVAFDPAINRVLVAYLDSVQLFTLSGLHYLATIATQGYQPAQCLACTWPNRLYGTEPMAMDTSLGRAVAISGVNGKGTAQIIDMESGRVLHTVSVGIQPINVQVDTALHRAYILDTGSCEVNILDLRSEKLVANVAVGRGPLGLAVDEPTGKVFVTQGVVPGRVIMFPAATTVHQPGCYPLYPSVQ